MNGLGLDCELGFFHCLTEEDDDDLLIQVADVKKTIETIQGADVYPAAQQMLIHQGKVLKDNTTLDENKVADNSFIVVMLSKVSLVVLFWGSCLLISVMKGKMGMV